MVRKSGCLFLPHPMPPRMDPEMRGIRRTIPWVLVVLFWLPGLSLDLTGSWEAKVGILPEPRLSRVSFTMEIADPGFSLYTTSIFEGERGFVEERFGLSGKWGPFSLGTELILSPADVILKSTPYTASGDPADPPLDPPAVEWRIAGPIYRSSSLRLSLSLFGAKLSFTTGHFMEHVLEFSYEDFGQTWSTTCSSNARYLNAARDREINAPEAVILYYADPGKSLLIARETVKGPFEVLPDLSDYTWAARTYLENLAASHAPGLGAVAFEVPPPSREKLVFSLWVPYYMRYTFTAEVPHIRARAVFDDVGNGTHFDEMNIVLEGIGLCCGITAEAELSFSKCRGFEYLKITLDDLLKFCCGIDLDLTVKFTTDHKEVTLDFDGIVLSPNVIIYAEPELISPYVIGGLRIYGFEIRCHLNRCTYLRSLTAFAPYKVEEIIGEDIFRDAEYELIEIGICGRVCCGRWYRFRGYSFFGGPGFMGVTRVGAELTASLFPGFEIGFTWDTSPSFSITWRLDF